jgi:hypothetical protein
LSKVFEDTWSEIEETWEIIGQPIWDVIEGCIETVNETFEELMPEISQFVDDCFEDIDTYWNETLQPCLEAIGKYIEEELGPAFEEVFGTVIPVAVEGCFDYIVFLWDNTLMPCLTGITTFINGIFSQDWKLAFDGLEGILEGFTSISGMHWQAFMALLPQEAQEAIASVTQEHENLKQQFAEKINPMIDKWMEFCASLGEELEPVVATVTTKFNEIKNEISLKVNDAWADVKEAFANIKSDIEEKMTEAKEKVGEIIEEIKGFFDFTFTWPKIPMPHFSISPAGWKADDLLKGTIPSLSVQFYAKGGILNDPTIFGMNGNSLMVGGEAGPEAVAPIETLQGYVAAAVASQNVMLVECLDRIHDAILSLDENMGGHLKEALDDTSLKVNNREFGRLVRGVT